MTKLIITGQRPQRFGKGWGDHSFHRQIKQRIKAWIYRRDIELVLTGMSLGVEQWGAQVAWELDIPFIAAIPCKAWSDKWTPDVKQRYNRLLKRAAEVHYIDRTPGYIQPHIHPDKYVQNKIGRAQHWLLDQTDECDAMLVVVNRGPRVPTWFGSPMVAGWQGRERNLEDYLFPDAANMK